MSDSLEKIIKDTIQHGGPISVETYWNLCLAHPQYGYYITRDPLGQAGDFTTSPEISQLFGEMLGVWVAEQWTRLRQPTAFYLVECGPGRGTLMADLLRIGKMVPGFMDAARIHLVETSPALRDRQRTTLKDVNVTFADDLISIPSDLPVIIISNEFLDALPIRQFMVTDNGTWLERMVGVDTATGRLTWGFSPSVAPHPYIAGQGFFEISVARENIITEISHRIKNQSGASVMVDYGHLHSAFGDTFQAVRNHQFCDVLKDCGDADLTSHVDFCRLKAIAELEGCVVTLSQQGDFLKRMGIGARAAQLAQKSEDIISGFHRLTDDMSDNSMGKLFKVMEVYG